MKSKVLAGGLLLASLSAAFAGDLTVDGNLQVNGRGRFNVDGNSGAFIIYNVPNGLNQLRVDGVNQNLLLQESNGNVGIGLGTPRTRLEIAGTPSTWAISPPTATAVIGRSIVDWHYEQGFDSTTYYIKLADVSGNNSSVQIEGLIGGHTPGQGKAAVNLLVSERDSPVRMAMVMGNLGLQDIRIYKNADNSSSIYLVGGDWAEVTLRLTQVSTSSDTITGSILYPKPIKSTAVPTGTLVFTLSQNAQFVLRSDGKISMAKQGDIYMGEFGNSGSGD